MTIMSRECLQKNIDFDKQGAERFPEPVKSLALQRVRIFEDVLNHYENEEHAEYYCRDNIQTFKATAGILCPIDQAKFCINLYHEILGKEKEK